MELNQENVRKIKGIIIFTVAAVVVGVNYRGVLGLLAGLMKMALPFLIGMVIAFILNVPMRKIESFICPGKEKRWKRPLSLTLSILGVLGIMLIVLLVVVPELFQTLVTLQESVPVFLEEVQRQAQEIFATYPEIVNYISQIEVDWRQTLEGILSFLGNGAGTVLSTTFSAAMSIVSGIATFGIGFIFAVYILLQKETLARQIKKFLRAFLKDKAANRIFEIAALTEKTFSNFLTGQCLEAVILGLMFFVTLSIFRMPYAVLIGVLIAFTALIPMFGAFIGLAVGAFLMLIVNPVQAFIFIIMFFVLQQIEGNLIYPHVVGNSVGLPSIWVLVAVTVGGSAMGIVGMLIFIPLCSVGYSLLREEVNKRTRLKNTRVKKEAPHPSNGQRKRS
ncbi:AI-2E family transporter [Clostridium sp. chh4-2]|uniref:AI-2E family transporter n=1 Tax=Clostridium sp. chh4-2 TaxID=2067550 RepID=UPI000CCF314A|nr:AI-2E family transporter [Clostridium sp. chh4-2]PNV59343.1 AI-2E family transporter [Clostridium sp. chh4-2]